MGRKMSGHNYKKIGSKVSTIFVRVVFGILVAALEVQGWYSPLMTAASGGGKSRIAVVTGSNRGIGKEICKQLSEQVS